ARGVAPLGAVGGARLPAHPRARQRPGRDARRRRPRADRAASSLPRRHRPGVPGVRRLVVPLAHRLSAPAHLCPRTGAHRFSRSKGLRFFSDNTATACPEILTALEGANRGLAKPYGEDEWTARLDGAFSAFFGTEARAFAVATGTAANSLSLATLSPPYGAIFAHQEAHIAVDECGAPGFFSGGAQLALLAGEHGRLEAATFRAALGAYPPGDVHKVQPAALSITQATELGTCYRREPLAELCAIAHERGLKVHMD